MNDLVSVIVPIYKVEDYLDRCIISVVQQEYKNLEIILVDDGSPDRCPSICNEWFGRDERIKVIHKSNGGLSDARNAGMSYAHGEYFVFVDSDDYLEPTMISKMMRLAQENKVKMVLTNFRCVYDSGERAVEAEESPIKNGLFNSEELFPLLYKKYNWFFIVAWNKLYHRSLFENVIFPVGKIHEDEFVVAQLMWNAGRIICNDTEEYVYIYKRKGSIMTQKNKERYQYLFEAMSIRHEFFVQEKLYEDAFRTRQKYFEELEKITCRLPDHGGLSAIELKEAKRLYAVLKGKNKKERLCWFLYCVNPQFEYKITRLLRKLFKRNNRNEGKT